MKVLIPNVTSPKNIGDLAAVSALIENIRRNFSDSFITIHSSDPELHNQKISDSIKNNIYSWAVFENPSFFSRIFRTSLVFIYYISHKISFPFPKAGQLADLIKDYQTADIIFFVGGVYFRSKKGLTQSLNLIMLAMMFKFAKFFKGIKISGPMSFGPFAHKWQGKMVARAISGFDIVAAREKYSLELMNMLGLKSSILSCDFALLVDAQNLVKENSMATKPIFGFTIRNWLPTEKQKKFEDDFVSAVADFCLKNKMTVLPIVQVSGKDYGETDLSITKMVAKKLSEKGLDVLEIFEIKNLESAFEAYSSLSLLFGMRMHSNILAAVSGTPFAAISYEYKTEGIAQQLGMGDYCLKCQEADKEKIYLLLEKAYKNREENRFTIKESLKKIKKEEQERWSKILYELCSYKKYD